MSESVGSCCESLTCQCCLRRYSYDCLIKESVWLCQTRVPNQSSMHKKYLFALNACLNVCLFVLNACDILYLLQGSQRDRNHQSSHQNRAQDLLKIENKKIVIFGKTVPREFSPWRCRLRLPKTIGKYSLNVMCCNKLRIDNQRCSGGKMVVKR